MVKQLQTRLNAISTEQTVLSMRIISHYECKCSADSMRTQAAPYSKTLSILLPMCMLSAAAAGLLVLMIHALA